ncbi:MAG: pyridoxal phosphate-dependent aminotransferase [Victivallaceae bacterium]|nr:pyridoxal phosphate-dependent aminotransferase [Victivallaceae bacterium]
MGALANNIKSAMTESSWIRRMFEAGIEMKKEFGADNVYDFSLGNPDAPPPKSVKSALCRIAENSAEPFAFGYMPNAGYPESRSAVAASLSHEQKIEVPSSHVVLTVGAAGALNVLFRAILEKNDEIICPAPYFVEYKFYVINHGGILKPVPAKDFTFELDVAAIEKALTPNTRAVMINSPNNPTGQIYSRAELQELTAVMQRHMEKTGRILYLISDEPYRALNFENVEVPPLFGLYPYTVIVGSYSKTLSLAGERIGYLAVSPEMPEAMELINGVTMTNRILGFVNAPAIAQKLLVDMVDEHVDVNIYRERRDAMAKVLNDAGIKFTMPKGALYFFPKSPTTDETIFIDALKKERILVVPGKGFGYSGYFRMAFCVPMASIKNSADGFKRAVKAVKP